MRHITCLSQSDIKMQGLLYMGKKGVFFSFFPFFGFSVLLLLLLLILLCNLPLCLSWYLLFSL